MSYSVIVTYESEMNSKSMDFIFYHIDTAIEFIKCIMQHNRFAVGCYSVTLSNELKAVNNNE